MLQEPILRRRRLPHWDVPGATYFVTSCLAGSMPAQGLANVEQYRQELEGRRRAPEMSEDEWEIHKSKLLFARVDHWLDSQPVVQHLRDPRLAEEVRKSIYHFAGERYDVYAWVVMASHFHWLFKPTDGWVESLGPSARERTPRERIMQSIRRHTARQCNKLLNREGTFWQDESYDHCVRSADELLRIIEYVEMNPVKAGLCDCPEEWNYSSACDRQRWGIGWEDPLVYGTDL